ncbi:hypothetical protein M514_26235 [Trichuris suis]|uniref:Brinker DNA-binding domain-containing protein n=1 Tax=Trichuris suis TaxID=68888 RepID=A0A085MWF1_9BILA|nr:hypothetical protein M514_26235 [Trichuris suis]
MQCATRRSYGAGFKLQVVKMAKETNNSQAARKYSVTQKMVIDWRNQEEALKKTLKTKCARRSAIVYWPEMENHLAQWVRKQRQRGHITTGTDMRNQVMKWTISPRVYPPALPQRLDGATISRRGRTWSWDKR